MYYLLFLMALEFVLRFIYVVFKLIFPIRKQSELDNRQPPPVVNETAQQGSPSEIAESTEVNGQNTNGDAADSPAR